MKQPEYSSSNLLLMRAVGVILIAASALSGAWVFVPFAIAYTFRDVFAQVLYAHTTELQRYLIRFAQWRVMGSAVTALIAVVIYHAGTLTVIAIFAIAWIDVIWKLLTQPPAQPAQPALPAEVTHAVTRRPPDRIIRP